MIADEIRSAYLKFFEEKGHKIIPSSSLIPHGDPTLLLTSAGMVQFKPYFLGLTVPPSPRLASCQKCFRLTDIESVGDPTHLTFFEMLGNFSIGDYFKQEAISWAWEFVTQRLKLPEERLWVTIFLDDDESFHYWREQGVPEWKILRFGEQENFWGPAGSSGPCGPCSEIHFDFGKAVGCGKPDCKPNCGCPRFSEIWNLVFTQYNQEENGRRTPLPKPNIDTGMGLERTVAAVIGKTSVYDTPLFLPLLDCLSEISGKKYGADPDTDYAVRVVAEHSRGIPFLIGDGVVPANEGRGYVLRRLIRRAVLFGRKLELEKPFLAKLAQVTIAQMGHLYPEIGQGQDFILKLIELEESRFGVTLSAGLALLDELMADLARRQQKEISGEEAFKLYDTYGFPVELTKEIARGRGFSVDLADFEREMEKQRERAREARVVTGKATLRGRGTVRAKATVLHKRQFVGYDSLKHSSAIFDLLVDNERTKRISEGQEASLILEDTPFYGEMGGQVGDTGQISGARGRFVVTNAIWAAGDIIGVPTDIIVHQGHVSEGSLAVGDKVEAVVDRERRLDIARNHTATHLLQLALRQVLGKHVQQRGSLVAPEQFRFDFSHLTAMTAEELDKVQQLVNEKIRENRRVYAEEMPYKQALAEGAIALFDEKYGEVVRVLKIGEPPISAELCGGTHLNFTGEIGFFLITGESSIGAGLRRIEAVTGRGAEAFIRERLSSLENIARALGAMPAEVEAKVSGLVSTLDAERRWRQSLEKELAKKEAESLLGQKEEINGVNLLVAKVPSTRLEVLREMSDFIRDKLKSVIVVLGSVYEDKPVFLAAITPDLVAKGYHAGEIVKQVAKVAGGGGGGKPNLAQAGGKNKSKLDEALRLAKSLVAGRK